MTIVLYFTSHLHFCKTFLLLFFFFLLLAVIIITYFYFILFNVAHVNTGIPLCSGAQNTGEQAPAITPCRNHCRGLKALAAQSLNKSWQAPLANVGESQCTPNCYDHAQEHTCQEHCVMMNLFRLKKKKTGIKKFTVASGNA